ncbi:MAG: hemolysin family protein [Acidobacteriota bacterium]
MSPIVWVVLAGLIAANALYVAAEFGAVGVRRSRVRRMAEDGNWLAQRLLPHVGEPAALDRYVGASQVGITISSLMVGAYAQATLTSQLAPVVGSVLHTTQVAALSIAALVVLVGLTGFQLILGELVPKALALQYPTETALATVLPMTWSLVAFRPVIAILNGTALLFLRLIGAGNHAHQHLHSPEEIDLLIAESRDGGLLEPQEQQRLSRALHLGRHAARDLMVPLDRLTMLEASASPEEVLQTVSASPFSRLPVYKEHRDAIIGFLRVKDLVDRYASESTVVLDRLIRPALQVQDDLPADRVLALLRERRAHSAVAIDRQGRALGLVTIQDLLGQLLGLSRATASGAPSPKQKRGRA